MPTENAFRAESKFMVRFARKPSFHLCDRLRRDCEGGPDGVTRAGRSTEKFLARGHRDTSRQKLLCRSDIALAVVLGKQVERSLRQNRIHVDAV